MQVADVQIPEKERYTYADYARLPEGAPYQLIHGELVMSPAPSVYHQRLIGRVFRMLDAFVREHDLGEAFVSPIDVYLSEEDTPQPDIAFVANERAGIVGEQQIEGAPDLVVEVLSPSTGYYDLKGKKRLYEAHGVKEYWIVDPKGREVEVYGNTDGGFVLTARAVDEGTVASNLLDGFAVNLADLF